MEELLTEGAPTTATAVANAFLDIQDADQTRFQPIDQMKLQKLLFYSHAWWLAYTDTPLFGDDVEAWPWGPVVRNVYADFRDFGREPISGRRGTELVLGPNGAYVIAEPPPPSPQIVDFLRKVWETHKGLTGVQLSNSTHAPGEPWTIVKERYASLDLKPRIPNAVIRDVFRKKIAQQGGEQAAS